MHQLLRILYVIGLVLCDDDDVPSVTLESVEYNATNITTTTEEINLEWLQDAVKDIAYYLRQYKFNEYDRRYQKKPINGSYYAAFPKPPLRGLHWEVQLHCEVSFVHCMEYLNKKVKLTGLRRKDDTSIIMVEQNWTSNNTQQINTIDKECQDKKKTDNFFAPPFQGPIERFKWRTSASYFLCWYAMNGVPTLEHIGEPCDNFAYCLDPKLGAQNKDTRADDTQPFSCALYSFCPDPCCPILHISTLEECYNSELNPCQDNANRTCSVPRSENTDLTSVILNHWNVSCVCSPGYSWHSKSGLCVDVDECAAGTHSCSAPSEVCVNQPGGFVCVCGWGYVWRDKCEQSNAVLLVKEFKETEGKQRFRFSFKELLKKVFGSDASVCCVDMYSIVFMYVVLLIIR